MRASPLPPTAVQLLVWDNVDSTRSGLSHNVSDANHDAGSLGRIQNPHNSTFFRGNPAESLISKFPLPAKFPILSNIFQRIPAFHLTLYHNSNSSLLQLLVVPRDLLSAFNSIYSSCTSCQFFLLFFDEGLCAIKCNFS